MSSSTPLAPTLWRTCRVLANRLRLQMFGLLLRQPGQTVSAVAAHVHQPLALTSVYLRALEARGLLTVRRTGRWVSYRPSPTTGAGASAQLVAALRATFQREAQPVEAVFRRVTAFTHPRRIELFRRLQPGPRTLGQLRAEARISAWALRRHLAKLEARGFITEQGGFYVVVDQADDLGVELARLAAQ